MKDRCRLIRDATERFKIELPLPGGQYQLSLDDQAVTLLTNELGYSERDVITDGVVPILIARGDAWFPNQRDVDSVIDDFQVQSPLVGAERDKIVDYVTDTGVKTRNVGRLLAALEKVGISTISEEDLSVRSLPSIPSSIDMDGPNNREPASNKTEGSTANPRMSHGQSEADSLDEGAAQFEEIPGIGPKRSQKLAESGIDSLSELAETRPDDLAASTSIPETLAAVAIEGARELETRGPAVENRLASQTGIASETFDAALSSLAASGVPPSEAASVLRTAFGPSVADLSSVDGEQVYFLWKSGYRTPYDLSKASIEELESVEQLGPATAPKIKQEAQQALSSFESS